ncbi:MAG: MFS transporter [Proteobacteria bacterium]|nr:MFS transporter [Pseudomonadota bacterium]
MTLRATFILTALTVGRVAFGYQFQSIASLATDLVPRFHLTYAQLGSLIGAYMLLGVVSALPIGLLGRRFGDRIVLSVGLFLMTAGAAWSAYAGGPGGMAVGRAVAGLGAVAMIVMQGKVIGEWFTGSAFMLAIGLTVCAFSVGMGLAQLVLPLLSEGAGLQTALISTAIPAGISFLLFAFGYTTPPHAGPIERRFSMPSMRECVLLSVAGLTWMTFTAGYGAFAAYLPSALTLRGDGAAIVALAMTVLTWGNAPATMAGSGLANRFGNMTVFMFGTVAMVVGMAGMAIHAWPVFWAVLVGIVGGIHPGIIMAVGTLSARAENRAAGMGLFYMVYYAGGAGAPALCGIAADAYGSPDGGLLAAAAISTLGIPMFLLHRLLLRHWHPARARVVG